LPRAAAGDMMPDIKPESMMLFPQQLCYERRSFRELSRALNPA
jgi:hypothetical protein